MLYIPPFFENQSPSPIFAVMIQVFIEKIKSKNGKYVKKNCTHKVLPPGFSSIPVVLGTSFINS